MNLLTVMPCHSGDAMLAENLLDWTFQLNERKQSGSLLVVCYGDTHEEMREKLSIAGDVACSNFEMIISPEIASPSKSDRIAQVFNFAADHIAKNYRVPWLWLEPDSVPLRRGWLEELDNAYTSQPKMHLGPHFQAADKRILMSRTAIYSPKLSKVNLPLFTTASADVITPASTKTRLIQQIYYKPESDLVKIRPDAVLLHSDKTGKLIQYLRSKL